MFNQQVVQLAAMAMFISLTACTPGGFSVLSGTTDESSTIDPFAKVTAGLKAGGITDAEAAAIVSSVESELAQSSSAQSVEAAGAYAKQSNDIEAQAVSAQNLPSIVRGAMKALGKNAFTSADRKKVAVKTIARQIPSVFGDELSQLASADLQVLVQKVVEEQVKATTHAQLSSADQDASIKDLIQESLAAADSLANTSDKKAGWVRSVAEGSIGVLGETGASTSRINTLVPEIVQVALTGVDKISASSEQKSQYMLDFILRTYDNLGRSGVSTADIASVSDSISVVINAASVVPTAVKTQTQVNADENRSCSESSRWVYMFEFSDSRCQTLVKRYVEGPIQGSPLGRGFPNHAFCFRDDSNNKYYNWVGGAKGCSNAPPSLTSFPSPPSPRALSVTADSSPCSWSMSTGAGLSNSGTHRLSCESNALLNFVGNGRTNYMEVTTNGVVAAVFDRAPVGMTFPSYSLNCSLADLQTGSSMHYFYVRDQKECLSRCEDVIAPFPQYSYRCKLEGVSIKTYAENEFTAPVVPAVVSKLKWSLPSAIKAAACTKVGISVLANSDQVEAGLNRPVALEGSRQIMANGDGSPLLLYSNSSCTNVVLSPTLAPDAQAKDYFIKPAAGAVTLNFSATPVFSATQKAVISQVSVTP